MTKKAVLIGINYVGTSAELKGCVNDVTNIAGILMTTRGYLPANVRTLTDSQATKAGTMEAIRWLVSKNKPGDTLVFYYSGHGSTIVDKNGDETDKKDEVLVPADYSTQGFIDDDWLYKNLAAKVPAGVTLYGFTDCCHSGTMLDMRLCYDSTAKLKTGTLKIGMPFVPSNWTDSYSFTMQRNATLPGNVVLFSGCQDNQTSADAFINNTAQGAFTYCFIAFLKQNTRTKLLDLLKYLKCTLQINGFGSQVPRLSTGKLSDIDAFFNL